MRRVVNELMCGTMKTTAERERDELKAALEGLLKWFEPANYTVTRDVATGQIALSSDIPDVKEAVLNARQTLARLSQP